MLQLCFFAAKVYSVILFTVVKLVIYLPLYIVMCKSLL